MAYSIQEIPVENLSVYVNNSRTHSTEQVKQISNSIKEFGFTNPLLIDKNKEIIAGHGRLMAAKQLGLDKVPCIELSNLSEKQKKAYVIADNQLALNAGWNESILSMEIGDLSDNDFDISLLGFNDLDLNKYLLKEFEGLTDEDEVPEPPKEPITKLGDIWQLGNHRVMCGDATNKNAVKLLMENNKADLLFTDPPYNVNYTARTGIRSGKIRDNMSHIKNDNLNNNQFNELLENSFKNIFDYMDNKASYYICNNWHCADVFKKILYKLNINVKAWIVWNKDWMSVGHSEYRSNHEFIFFGTLDHKNRIFHNKGKENDVWTLRKLPPANKIHTTEKPVGLVDRAIKNSSNNNQIVIDFFSGSGSTLIGCEKNNRIFKGLELDPKYCDVIVKRWENFTGKKAKLIKDNHATT